MVIINDDPPLISAVKTNDTPAVKRLLASTATDVNATDSEGRSALYHAVRLNRKFIAERLIVDPSVDLNLRSKAGWTPFAGTLMLGDADLAQKFLDTGQGKESTVKLLLDLPGVDANDADTGNWTALSYAVGHGHAGVTKLLLAAKGVNPEPKDAKDGTTPIFTACEQGYTDILRQLLAAPGVDVTARSVTGDTLLHVAALNGQDEVVRILLATGKMDVDVKDDKGRTAREVAVQSESVEVVALLEGRA
ncbi:Inversin [Podospora aff. communis PSN243]|uniref:Inversin n=1 Tax=Podospora aff. communis PSN243 TaxID=3040156 RepID=A0AAV9GPS1_9PEZI|nr:Inversin [Podospora aff. communis PSN243]